MARKLLILASREPIPDRLLENRCPFCGASSLIIILEKNSDGFVVDCQCDLSLGEGAVRIRRTSRVQIITGTEQDGQAIDDDPLDECHVTRMFDNFGTCLRVDNHDDVRAIEMLINSQIREIESWSHARSAVVGSQIVVRTL